MASSETWLWGFRAGVGLILLAGLLFMLGFATDHWHDDDTVHYGLWETCSGATCTSHDADDLQAYHIATQGLQIAALAFFTLGPILHFFFYLCKKYKETGWRSRVFDVMYSIGVMLHIASVIVFGVEHPNSGHLSWSYRMSAAATPISVMGIFLVIISRSKALARFQFKTSTKSTRKKKVGVLDDSRANTPQNGGGRRSVRAKKRKEAKGVSMASPREVQPGNPSEVNVNITITNPSPSGSAFSTESSKMFYPAPYGYHQQSQMGHHSQHSNASPIASHAAPHIYHGDFDVYAHQEPSLTNVMPAPFSPQRSNPITVSSQRHTFGPSEKQRILNPSDSHVLGPIRGTPSAPPPDSPEHLYGIPEGNPPPYSDTIESEDITRMSTEQTYNTSVV